MISIRHEPPYTQRYWMDQTFFFWYQAIELIAIYLFVMIVDDSSPEEGFATGAAQSCRIIFWFIHDCIGEQKIWFEFHTTKMVTSCHVTTNATYFRSFRCRIISATGRGRFTRIHHFRLFSVGTLNNPAASKWNIKQSMTIAQHTHDVTSGEKKSTTFREMR